MLAADQYDKPSVLSGGAIRSHYAAAAHWLRRDHRLAIARDGLEVPPCQLCEAAMLQSWKGSDSVLPIDGAQATASAMFGFAQSGSEGSGNVQSVESFAPV